MTETGCPTTRSTGPELALLAPAGERGRCRVGSVSEVVAIALATVFIAIVVVAAVSWCGVVVYGIRAVRHTRTGVKPWSRAPLWNPANLILRPDLLTEEGRLYRRRCFRALLVFAISVAILLVFGAMMATLK